MQRFHVTNRDSACNRPGRRSAFALGSRRDIEDGAGILYVRCVRWGMIPHTAGKTVAMYFGHWQPLVNLREFLPDEAPDPPGLLNCGTERRQ